MAEFGEPLHKSVPKYRYLPAFIKNYLRYVIETEPAPIHHIGSALALASQAIGGASYVRYGSKEVTMNLYIGLTAPSGFRKTEAIRLAMSVYSSASERFDALKPPLPDISSNTAILQACDSRNNERTVSVLMHDKEYTYTSVFIVASEFASFIRSRDRDMITLLTNLFDGAVSNPRRLHKPLSFPLLRTVQTQSLPPIRTRHHRQIPNCCRKPHRHSFHQHSHPLDP